MVLFVFYFLENYSDQRKIINMPILVEIMVTTYMLKNCATTGWLIPLKYVEWLRELLLDASVAKISNRMTSFLVWEFVKRRIRIWLVQAGLFRVKQLIPICSDEKKKIGVIAPQGFVPDVMKTEKAPYEPTRLKRNQFVTKYWLRTKVSQFNQSTHVNLVEKNNSNRAARATPFLI